MAIKVYVNDNGTPTLVEMAAESAEALAKLVSAAQAQDFTDEEKAQARENIGALGVGEVDVGVTSVNGSSGVVTLKALNLSLNGTAQTAFNGTSAVSINITPSSIGAATASHTHAYLSTSGGTCTGTVYAPAFQISSDIRLKSNLKKLCNASGAINQLTGYSYDMVGFENRRVGLIAQDVQKVLPEAVMVNDRGYLTIDYAAICALLVNVAKKQDQRLAVLESRYDL